MQKNTRSAIIVLVILLIAVVGLGVRRYQVKHRTDQKNVTVSPVTTGVHDYSLEVDGKSREYKLYVPKDYTGKDSAPVVIYLHGGGGSSDSAEKDGLYAYADKYGFILAAPAGTGILGDKALTWNAGSWSTPAGGGSCCGYAVDHRIDDVHFISHVVEDIEGKYNINSKEVYATGISNGALMSLRLGCEMSETFAAIAPVASPGVPEPCSPSQPTPMMYIHGTADPCAPYAGGTGGGCIGNQKFDAESAQAVVNNWRSIVHNTADPKSGYQKGQASCQTYPGNTPSSDVEFCTITNGGHTWPSGNQYLPVKRVGAVSYDLSFDQIWEFFSHHTR